MADAPDLDALALLERGSQRALPVTGKSQRLLLRRRLIPAPTATRRPWSCCGGVPFEAMQERLAKLKATWLSSGDSAAFFEGLR